VVIGIDRLGHSHAGGHMIIAIDPGPKESGYVLIPNEWEMFPESFGKIDNDALGILLSEQVKGDIVIEKPVCRKWAGREVSDTAIIAGYLAGKTYLPVYLITRSKVRGHFKCTRGGDKAVKNVMVGRFAPGVPNHGKGLKDSPGFFYGFKSDIWQAYALGVAYLDMWNNQEKKDIEYLEENKFQ
jgi:hypothetical protein